VRRTTTQAAIAKKVSMADVDSLDGFGGLSEFMFIYKALGFVVARR
jgi:hypothetical protein